MDISIPTVHSKMVNIKLTKPLLHHIFIKVHIHQSLINLQGAYTYIHLHLLMIITITQLASYTCVYDYVKQIIRLYRYTCTCYDIHYRKLPMTSHTQLHSYRIKHTYRHLTISYSYLYNTILQTGLNTQFTFLNVQYKVRLYLFGHILIGPSNSIGFVLSNHTMCN